MTTQDQIVLLEDNHRLRAENDTLRRECDELKLAYDVDSELIEAADEIERLRQMSLDPKTVKEGDKVWWDDPADGLSSGVYTVVEVFTDCDAPADGETIVALRNEAGSEAEVLMQELCAPFTAAANEIERLRKERDEANFLVRRILSEINCRIDHGADSNGHLEVIYELFKKEETP